MENDIEDTGKFRKNSLVLLNSVVAAFRPVGTLDSTPVSALIPGLKPMGRLSRPYGTKANHRIQ